MTVTTVDAAAQAAIGAAARELHLPTVRAESNRLAEIAVRERQTHLGYLAEVPAANAAAADASARPSSLASSGCPSSTWTPWTASPRRPWPASPPAPT
jgi:hypothetical protein